MKYIFLIILGVWAFNSKDATVSVEKFDNFAQRRIENPNKDTIYFINLWATWCKPCVAELPFIEKVNGTMIDSLPVKTIMVSLDHYTSLESRVIPFLNSKNFSSEQVLLKDGSSNAWIDDFDSAFSGAIPATLILKNGKRKFHEGMYRSAKHILRDIKKL